MYQLVMSCGFCGALESLHRCSACHEIHYCNRECQRKHWRHHRIQCVGSAHNVMSKCVFGDTSKSVKNDPRKDTLDIVLMQRSGAVYYLPDMSYGETIMSVKAKGKSLMVGANVFDSSECFEVELRYREVLLRNEWT